MKEHQVLVAGGGSVGLMLAAELTLAGVDVVVVERREAGQGLESSRSGGLHARTIEVLDQRGVADRFLAEGRPMQVQMFAGTPLDISDFPSRHPYGLALWQKEFERILAAWVDELGVPFVRGHDVTGFAQDATGVDVELSGGHGPIRARYLVGCDGGRSQVRKTAGIEFAGWDPTVSSVLAEVEMTDDPSLGIRYDENGTQAMGRLEDGRVRVILTQRYAGQTSEPTLDDLREALVAVYGTDFGVHSPTSITRFTDATRQAATYRKGRVLLAGDSAHIHHPVGGQGLNIGLQDAVNLGWKLARVVTGTSAEALLDTYQAERHPVAARVLRTTMAQLPLTRSDVRIDALRGTISDLLGLEEPRKHIAGMVSGLDVYYDLAQSHDHGHERDHDQDHDLEAGTSHPLSGRRMPDLDLETQHGRLPFFALLHRARPVLLNLGDPGRFDAVMAGWDDRVELVDASYSGAWELPVLGPVTSPTAVLVRPDGHAAWVSEGTSQSGLNGALTRWFGPPHVCES